MAHGDRVGWQLAYHIIYYFWFADPYLFLSRSALSMPQILKWGTQGRVGEIRRDQSDSVENEHRCYGPVPSHLPGQAYRLANEIVGDFAWAPELLAPGTPWWDASTAICLPYPWRHVLWEFWGLWTTSLVSELEHSHIYLRNLVFYVKKKTDHNLKVCCGKRKTSMRNNTVCNSWLQISSSRVLFNTIGQYTERKCRAVYWYDDARVHN